MAKVRVQKARAMALAQSLYKEDVQGAANSALARAKATAPADTNTLAYALELRIRNRGFLTEVEVGVFGGVRGRPRYKEERNRPKVADYLFWIESGTAAKRVAPKPRRARDGSVFFAAGMSWRSHGRGATHKGTWVNKSYRRGIPENDFLVRAMQPVARRYNTRVIDRT